MLWVGVLQNIGTESSEMTIS
uniref:Uncharacterized protein n=1 Tax=Strongyloides papillosus TaxID=174720 RepID=A0A0N5CII2_STREA